MRAQAVPAAAACPRSDLTVFWRAFNVVMAQGGDLRHALAADDGDEFRWDRRGWDIAVDILRGLCHIHASNVIHRRAPAPLRRTTPVHHASVPQLSIMVPSTSS